MGSPLVPSFANLFFGYYEALLFKRVNQILMYYRYVDDIFPAFDDEDECNEFLSRSNSLHPSLLFCFEKECSQTLPFLDVLMEKNDYQFYIRLQKADFYLPIHSLEFFLPHET